MDAKIQLQDLVTLSSVVIKKENEVTHLVGEAESTKERVVKVESKVFLLHVEVDKLRGSLANAEVARAEVDGTLALAKVKLVAFAAQADKEHDADYLAGYCCAQGKFMRWISSSI